MLHVYSFCEWNNNLIDDSMSLLWRNVARLTYTLHLSFAEVRVWCLEWAQNCWRQVGTGQFVFCFVTWEIR